MVSLYEMMQENTSLSVHRRRSLPLGGAEGGGLARTPFGKRGAMRKNL